MVDGGHSEGYIPTEADIASAELMLTPEQAIMSEVRENLFINLRPEDITPERSKVFGELLDIAADRAIKAEKNKSEQNPITFLSKGLDNLETRFIGDDRDYIAEIKARLRILRNDVKTALNSLKSSEALGGLPATNSRLAGKLLDNGGYGIKLWDTVIEVPGGYKDIKHTSSLIGAMLQEWGFIGQGEDWQDRLIRARHDENEEVIKDEIVRGNVRVTLRSSKVHGFSIKFRIPNVVWNGDMPSYPIDGGGKMPDMRYLLLLPQSSKVDSDLDSVGGILRSFV